LIPTAEEHEDSIPTTVLTEEHVFVSYENIPHDVWHAAYGVFCGDTITTYKTVQYEWLLRQSLDGSPFVDPRDGTMLPGTGGASGAGGTAGAGGMPMGGAAGAAQGGAAGSMAAGGTSTTAGTGGTPSTAGTPGGPVAAAGTGGTSMTPMATPPNTPSSSTDSEGGGCAMTRTNDTSSWLLFAAVGSWLMLRRRRQ
jgi:hypothetical protein